MENTLVDIYKNYDTSFSLEKGGYADVVAEKLFNMKDSSIYTKENTISFDELKERLNNNDGSEIAIFTNASEGHHIAVVGVETKDGENFVRLKDSANDPGNQFKLVSFNSLFEGSNQLQFFAIKS